MADIDIQIIEGNREHRLAQHPDRRGELIITGEELHAGNPIGVDLVIQLNIILLCRDKSRQRHQHQP